MLEALKAGLIRPRSVLGVEIVHQSNRNFVDEVCGFHAYRLTLPAPRL